MDIEPEQNELFSPEVFPKTPRGHEIGMDEPKGQQLPRGQTPEQEKEKYICPYIEYQ